MRRCIRHPSDIPIDCRLAPHRPGRREYLKNISSGGLCFETPEALPRGRGVQLTIPIREPAFEVMGTIVWCRRAHAHYDVGVRFADADTEFAVRMVEQICQIHHYQREVLEQEGRARSGAEAAAAWVAKYARDFPA